MATAAAPTITTTRDFCKASPQDQRNYAACMVSGMWREDQMTDLLWDEGRAGKSKKWHEKLFELGDRFYKWGPFGAGGEKWHQQAAMAVVMGTGAAIMRGAQAMKAGREGFEKMLPEDVLKTAPFLRKVFGAYAGMKLGGAAEQLFDRKLYRELGPVTKGDLDAFARGGDLPKALVAKLSAGARDAYIKGDREAARKEILARARMQVADEEFRKASRVAHAELSQAVDRCLEQEILRTRASVEAIKEATAHAAAGTDEMVMKSKALQNVLGEQVGKEVGAIDARRARAKEIENVTRRRRVFFKTAGAIAGWFAPEVIDGLLHKGVSSADLGSAHRGPGAGATGHELGHAGRGPHIPGVDQGVAIPPEVHDFEPPWGDELAKVKAGEGISGPLMREFMYKGMNRGEALRATLKILMEKHDITITDPKGHVFTFDEIKAKLDAGEKISDIYYRQGNKVDETGVRHIGERYGLTTDDTSYAEAHDTGVDERAGGGITEPHEYGIHRTPKAAGGSNVGLQYQPGQGQRGGIGIQMPTPGMEIPDTHMPASGGMLERVGDGFAKMETIAHDVPHRAAFAEVNWTRPIPVEVSTHDLPALHQQFEDAQRAIDEYQKFLQGTIHPSELQGEHLQYLQDMEARLADAQQQLGLLEGQAGKFASALKGAGAELIFRKSGDHHSIAGFKTTHPLSHDELMRLRDLAPKGTAEHAYFEKLFGETPPRGTLHIIETNEKNVSFRLDGRGNVTGVDVLDKQGNRITDLEARNRALKDAMAEQRLGRSSLTDEQQDAVRKAVKQTVEDGTFVRPYASSVEKELYRTNQNRLHNLVSRAGTGEEYGRRISQALSLKDGGKKLTSTFDMLMREYRGTGLTPAEQARVEEIYRIEADRGGQAGGDQIQSFYQDMIHEMKAAPAATGTAREALARSFSPEQKQMAFIDKHMNEFWDKGVAYEHKDRGAFLKLVDKRMKEFRGSGLTAAEQARVGRLYDRIGSAKDARGMLIDGLDKLFKPGAGTAPIPAETITPPEALRSTEVTASAGGGEALRTKALEIFNSNATYEQKLKAIEQVLGGLKDGEKIQVGPYDFVKEKGSIFYVDTKGAKAPLTPQLAQDLYHGWLRTQVGGAAGVESNQQGAGGGQKPPEATPEQVNMPPDKLEVIRQMYPRQAKMVNMAHAMMEGVLKPQGVSLQTPSFEQYQAAHAADGLAFKTKEEFLGMITQVAKDIPQFPDMDLTTVDQSELANIGALNTKLDTAIVGNPRAKAVFEHFMNIVERTVGARTGT